MKRRMRLALLFVLAPCGSAEAQQLYPVHFDRQMMIAADRDTIIWREGRPRVQVRTIFATPLAFGQGRWAHQMLEVTEFDCSASRRRVIEGTWQSLTDVPLDDIEPSDWREIGEDSPAGDVRRLVCSNEEPELGPTNSSDQLKEVYFRMLDDANRQSPDWP